MLRYVTWQTDEPIPLPAGNVIARGDASPQVRDPAQAAAIGDAAVLAVAIQAAIVQALTDALQGMEPSADQLVGLRDDIASAALVSSNMKLKSLGVTLLDLTLAELIFTDYQQP